MVARRRRRRKTTAKKRNIPTNKKLYARVKAAARRKFAVVLQRLPSGSDDDLELGGVLALPLLVLLVVMNVHLIGARRRFALLPEDVFNGLARFRTDVGIDVQFAAAGGFLVSTVDSLS